MSWTDISFTFGLITILILSISDYHKGKKIKELELEIIWLRKNIEGLTTMYAEQKELVSKCVVTIDELSETVDHYVTEELETIKDIKRKLDRGSYMAFSKVKEEEEELSLPN